MKTKRPTKEESAAMTADSLKFGPIVCDCCAKVLNPKTLVWLNAYGGEQGYYPFGPSCAKKVEVAQ